MNLALGPVLLVAVSLLLGGLMSLTMLGLLLMVSRGPRPTVTTSEHAAWRDEPLIDPARDGTAVVSPER